VIQVADSGCGMSPAFVRERLFRPFQTTKAGGMGIGAYEVAQYAKEMSGRIEVDSGPDQGTRFKLSFPLHREVPAALRENDGAIAA
jgi:signal transduction histidine kinase